MYLLEGIYAIFEFVSLRLKRPKLTLKIIGLITILLFILLAISLSSIILTTNWFTNLSIFNNQLIKQLILIDRLLIFIIIMLIFFLSILNNLLRQQAYKKLAKILKKSKGLKVVAISGSYGKTSTKIFLHTLLAGQVPLLTIPQNINTPVGIANFILKNLKPFHKILIVEIGAYKIGEIKFIGSILKPDISILTAISNQHLDLFGSQQNIIKAKFEIGQILKPKGILFINKDSKLINLNINHFKKLRPDVKIKTVSIKTKADYYATQISPNSPTNDFPGGISFKLHTKNSTIKLKTKLISPKFIINLLLAIATAKEFNVNNSHIIKKAQKICQPTHSLKIYYNSTKNNIIIDDSYSSNETGFIEAIKVAQKYNLKTKVIIFRPLIELGSKANQVHQKIVLKLAATFNYIIVTSTDYNDIISWTLKKAGFNMNHYFIIKNENKLLSLINKIAENDTLILLENRLSEKIVQNLLSKSCKL